MLTRGFFFVVSHYHYHYYKLGEMFINSTDTLRARMIDQTIPNTWNDKPPLFRTQTTEKRRWGRIVSQPPPAEEDPLLLKGVSSVSTSYKEEVSSQRLSMVCRTLELISDTMMPSMYIHTYR